MRHHLKVSCYSGQTYAERPVSFAWEGEKYEVAEIEHAWQEPGKRCFRVRTKDNKFFRLCYNGAISQWEIVVLARS